MRNPYTCGDAATPWTVHGPTVGDFSTFLYQFVGDLSKFDDPGLVDEDGEVVAHGYRATELLTRALLEYRSLSPDDRLEVQNLLKHIFDPRGTVFNGRPFLARWARNGGRLAPGPMLVFTRFASQAPDEERVTKLIVKFGHVAENDRALVVLCSTDEALAPQADVRNVGVT